MRWYQTSEFARLTGVTVRTLHHYDRIGLLKPSRRTAKGHRFYCEGDVARLQQIVTLKFLGFSLSDIKNVLDRQSLALQDALRLQREIIEEKRRRLDVAISAIRAAEHSLVDSAAPDWEAFAKIIEVITMQDNTDWMMTYYSAEAQQALAERGKDWTPEKQAQIEADWNQLFRDVEEAAAAGVDPASAPAQALVARWDGLIAAFTGGHPAITEGLDKLYADSENWQGGFQRPWSDAVGAFIDAARRARK